MKKRDRTGRDAIDWLKIQYRDFVELARGAGVRRALIDVYGLKPSKVSIRQATDWDLQARKELAADAEDPRYVLQPSRQTSYLRAISAEPEVRDDVQRSHIVALATRTRTESLMANARATQPDATPIAIANATALRIAERILDDLAKKN